MRTLNVYTVQKIGDYGFVLLNHKKIINPRASKHQRNNAKKAIDDAIDVSGLRLFDPETILDECPENIDDSSHKYTFITVTREELDLLDSLENVYQCKVFKENDKIKSIEKVKPANHEILTYYLNFKLFDMSTRTVVFQKSDASVLQIPSSRSERVNQVTFKERYYPHVEIKTIDVDINMSEIYFQLFLQNVKKVHKNLEAYRTTVYAYQTKGFFTIPHYETVRKYSIVFSNFIVKFCKLTHDTNIPQSVDDTLHFLKSKLFIEKYTSEVITVIFSLFTKSGPGDSVMKQASSCRKILDGLLFFIRFWLIYDGKKSKTRSAVSINNAIREELGARKLDIDIYDEILTIYKTIKSEEIEMKNNTGLASHNEGLIINNKVFKTQYLLSIFQICFSQLQGLDEIFQKNWDIKLKRSVKFYNEKHRGPHNELCWLRSPPPILDFEKNEMLKSSIDEYARLLLIAIYFSNPYPPHVMSLRTTLFQGDTNFYWYNSEELMLKIFVGGRSSRKHSVNYFVGKFLTERILLFLFHLKPIYVSLLAKKTNCFNSFDINNRIKTRILIDISNDFAEIDNTDEEETTDSELNENSNPHDKTAFHLLNNFVFSNWYQYEGEYFVGLYSCAQLHQVLGDFGIIHGSFGFPEFRQIMPAMLNIIFKDNVPYETIFGPLEPSLNNLPERSQQTYSQYCELSCDGSTSFLLLGRQHELTVKWQELLLNTKNGQDVEGQADDKANEYSDHDTEENIDEYSGCQQLPRVSKVSSEDITFAAQNHFGVQLRKFQDILLIQLMFSDAKSICVRFPTGFGKTVSIILFFKIYNILVSPIKVLIVVPLNTIKSELINKYKEIEAYNSSSTCEFMEVINMNSINLAFERSTKTYDYIFIDEFHEVTSHTYRNTHITHFNDRIYSKAKAVIYASATSFNNNGYPYKLSNIRGQTIENEISGEITTIDYNCLYDPKYKICNKRYEILSDMVAEVRLLIRNNKKVLIICRSFEDVDLFKMNYFKDEAKYITSRDCSESLLDSNLIIGTSIISSGVNIPGLNFVFIIDCYDLLYFIQCAGRLRGEGIAINVTFGRMDSECIGCLVYDLYGEKLEHCTHQPDIYDNIIKVMKSNDDYVFNFNRSPGPYRFSEINDIEIIEVRNKRQKSNLYSIVRDPSLKTGIESISKFTKIFTEKNVIKSFLRANKVSFNLESRNNKEEDLLLFVYLSKVANGAITFGEIIDFYHANSYEEAEKSIIDWFENSPFEIAKWTNYAKLKGLHLSCAYDKNNIQSTFDSIFRKIATEFCYIDLQSFSYACIAYSERTCNKYPFHEWVRPTYTEICKISRLVKSNCPTFETYFRKGGIFSLQNSYGMCFNCFRFNCTSSSRCPFKSRFPILIFMLIMFYNHHETLGVVEKFVQEIHFFDDWASHMLSLSDIKGIYNFHIWMVVLASTQEGKFILCLD